MSVRYGGLALLAVAVAAGGASRASAQPAGAFRDCPHCPTMLSVPAGSFTLSGAGRVRIKHRFAYSQDKISFLQWKQCVLAGQCESLGATGTASPEPVTQVSWLDIQQYLTWLSLETGAEYRLLSEIEWEYVARTAGGFRADGLEWTSDCWHVDLARAPADGSSWDTDGDCRYHVARGRRPGDSTPAIAGRFRFLFDARDAALGFRVARTLPD